MIHFEALKSVILRVLPKHSQPVITYDSRLVEDLGFDSLKLMQLLTEIEDEFDIFFDDSTYSRMRTVRQLDEIVKKESLACA
ncbi:acyl carrier protein [Thalassotalea fusca]